MSSNEHPVPPEERLAAAEANVAAAREKLTRDLAEVQARLDPKTIGRDAVDRARLAGERGVDAAKRNPRAVGGAAAALVLFLFRKPLARLFTGRPKAQKAARPMSETRSKRGKVKALPPPAPKPPSPGDVIHTGMTPTQYDAPHPANTSPISLPPVASNTASNEGVAIQGPTT